MARDHQNLDPVCHDNVLALILDVEPQLLEGAHSLLMRNTRELRQLS